MRRTLVCITPASYDRTGDEIYLVEAGP